MSFHTYLTEKKELQDCLLEFIDHNGIDEQIYQQFINVLNRQQILEIRSALKDLLHLINIISTNHRRTPDLFTKIDKILSDLKNEIKNNFTNSEIFHIFKQSKRVLLFLIQNDLFTIDQSIADVLLSPKYYKFKYPHYFYPEIKPFLVDEKMRQEIEGEVNKCSDNFEENRKIGENHTKICSLIRSDSLNDFRSHVTQTDTKPFSNVGYSIFDTNPLMYRCRATLLDYSAFFGSIQIFSFLIQNCRLSSETWLFAVHGNELGIIKMIEDHKINSKDPTYSDVLLESFRCQHHEITSYIKGNLLNFKDDRGSRILAESIKFYDYYSFPDDLNNITAFYNFCNADNVSFASGLLNLIKVGFKVNEKISNMVLNQQFFYNVSN